MNGVLRCIIFVESLLESHSTSVESLKFVLCIYKVSLICSDLLIRQLNFLRNCVTNDNKIVRHVYDCFGLERKELLK